MGFVSNHYRLLARDRHLLARCVFSAQEAGEHKAKLVGKARVKGKRLGVDGYNVLITVESLLLGRRLIRCDDGFVRDLRAIFGKYKTSHVTPRALREILREVSRAKPREVVWVFDKQVSRSGELAALTRELLAQAGVKGKAKTAARTDLEIGACEVAASSDRVIIKRARAVWDIPAEVLKRRRAKLLDLGKL